MHTRSIVASFVCLLSPSDAVRIEEEVTVPTQASGCSSNRFGIDFCNDWCNTPGKWGCGIGTMLGIDTRNTDNSDYTCSCDGCNGCGKEANFVMGTRSSNVCPSGYEQIANEPQCRNAAAALGKSFASSGSWSGSPKGCLSSEWDGRGVYYNQHASGSALNSVQAPICKQSAPTPEPTEAPTPDPTQAPTPEPTEAPTPDPTEAPTPEPTEAPTPDPTEAACSDLDVKLGDVKVVGGDSVGYPIVYKDGAWYPWVGSNMWDNNNGANVVCKQLGFDSGTLSGPDGASCSGCGTNCGGGCGTCADCADLSVPSAPCDNVVHMSCNSNSHSSLSSCQFHGVKPASIWTTANSLVAPYIRCVGSNGVTTTNCATSAAASCGPEAR